MSLFRFLLTLDLGVKRPSGLAASFDLNRTHKRMDPTALRLMPSSTPLLAPIHKKCFTRQSASSKFRYWLLIQNTTPFMLLLTTFLCNIDLSLLRYLIRYLIDQGYTFKIVTTLSERADTEAVEHDYAYKSPEEDRKLLRLVLTSDTELEKDQRAEDTAIRKNNPDGARLADLGVKRTAGSTLAQLSGGTGARYMAGPRKVHPMFAKRKMR